MAKTKAQWPEYLRFMLKRLYWHGSLCRQDIVNFLGLGTATASGLLAEFKSQYTEQVQPEGKCYVPVQDAPLPDGIEGNAFLKDLRHTLEVEGNPVLSTGTLVRARIMYPLERQVDTPILRSIILALKNRHALELDYVSMQPGAQRTRRTIEPQRLEYINDRWHLRAYCHKAAGWRHFVLSRILQVHGEYPATFFPYTEEFPERPVTFLPHPDLTEDQRQVVAFEFSMTDGKLSVQMDKDTLFYFMKHHVADLTRREGPPDKLLVLYQDPFQDYA